MQENVRKEDFLNGACRNSGADERSSQRSKQRTTVMVRLDAKEDASASHSEGAVKITKSEWMQKWNAPRWQAQAGACLRQTTSLQCLQGGLSSSTLVQTVQ